MKAGSEEKLAVRLGCSHRPEHRPSVHSVRQTSGLGQQVLYVRSPAGQATAGLRDWAHPCSAQKARAPSLDGQGISPL